MDPMGPTVWLREPKASDTPPRLKFLPFRPGRLRVVVEQMLPEPPLQSMLGWMLNVDVHMNMDMYLYIHMCIHTYVDT